MRRSLKLLSVTACGLGVLLVTGALALPLLLNSANVKQRLQARTAASLELDLEIGGRVAADFFPGLRFTVNDLHFSRQGSAVASAKQVRIGVALWPLLHREIRITSIELQEPGILLERYADGSYNVRKPQPRITLNLARIQVENATFHYNDALLGTRYEANACNLDVHGSRPLTRDTGDQLAALDLSAVFACEELRKDELMLADFTLSALAQAGVLQLAPVSMRLFGAEGTGAIEANFTGTVPVYALSYALPQFRINDLFRLLTPQTTPEGTLDEGALFEGFMDFTTTLSMQGQTLPEIKQTLSGEILLRGENLVINGADLDDRFARFESSQNFNLVDAGAFLVAGPLGLALTKGYNFANIFLEAGTRSEIPSFVSAWNVAEGVAQAQYVMMATNKNRVALKGGLDFPDERFNDVTIALLDENGCARVVQAIEGSFQNPEIDKPSVLWSLAGPVRALLQKLLPAKECEPFYAVAVEPQPV